MYETSDIKKGIRIEMDGNPYMVVEFQFVNPGKGSAFTRTKMKNMITGQVLERTFKTGEKLIKADTEDRVLQFMYNDSEYHFMDKASYEQVSVEDDVVDEAKNYLLENMEVQVSFFKGRPIAINLPNFVVLKVIETPPGEKGNTVTGAVKPATLQTGHTVNVPLFVNQGDHLKIDTRSGEYVERVKV